MSVDSSRDPTSNSLPMMSNLRALARFACTACAE
jgi:hypothetical protein